MADDEHPDKVARERGRMAFSVAVDIWKLEAGFVLQRSLLLSGLISIAMILYFLSENGDKLGLKVPISCFGLVCSLIWGLMNRGSKYWQDFWWQNVETSEREAILRDLFAKPGLVTGARGLWSAQRYSCARLMISLSDFTLLIWLVLIIKALASEGLDMADYLIIILTTLYASAVLIGGRFERSERGKSFSRF